MKAKNILPPLLFLAMSTEITAIENSFINFVICPPESSPTAAYQWICTDQKNAEIDAIVNGKTVRCVWTPRKCQETKQ